MPDEIKRVRLADVARFRGDFLSASPDATPLNQAWVIACEVSAAILGIDWARRFLSVPDRYFKMNADDEWPDSALRTHRVLQFGRQLYDLQGLPGFDDIVVELRTRDLTGASTELHIAHLLTQNGHPVRFVRRTGVKGNDFDQLVCYQSFDIPLEVKTKQDETDFSRATIEDSLTSAASKVPPCEPSLLAIRIPIAWTSNHTFIGKINDLVTSFFDIPTARQCRHFPMARMCPSTSQGYAVSLPIPHVPKLQARYTRPRPHLSLSIYWHLGAEIDVAVARHFQFASTRFQGRGHQSETVDVLPPT